MKRTARLLIGLLAGLPAAAFAQCVTTPQINPAPASGSANSNSFVGNMISCNGLASTATPTIDLSQYDGSRVAAQVNYSSTNFTAVTFTDGQESTGSITVVSTSSLVAVAATANVTILSTTGLNGAILTLQNGTTITKLQIGYQWFLASTTSGTANSLATAVAAISGLTANQAGSVVYSTVSAVGTAGNAWYLTSNNSSMTVSGAQFTGGANNAVVTINGVALTQGTQWTAQTTTSMTVASLLTAVTTQFSTLVANHPGTTNVIYTTSTLVGTVYNYSMTSNTSSITVSGMTGGINAGFALNGQLFVSSTGVNSGLTLALPVLYAIGASPALGGLTTGTTYYAVPYNATQFYLATSATGALSGLTSQYVTVTSTGATTSAHTYSVTPLPWTGTSTMTFQSSNDGVNWLTNQTLTMTSATAASSQGYDFQFYDFRYLRLNVQPPTTGAPTLTVPVYIKQDGIGRF